MALSTTSLVLLVALLCSCWRGAELVAQPELGLCAVGTLGVILVIVLIFALLGYL